jgi:NAD+ synthase (glutamine-hydrolysing)
MSVIAFRNSAVTSQCIANTYVTAAFACRLCVEEEIAKGAAAWLWDYLRRSGASGFLLPLSGGADSSSTAAIVGSMCQMVVQAVADGDAQVLEDARRCSVL